MKTYQIHGVMSLTLGTIAVILAAIALFMTSAGLGLIYLLGCAVAFVASLYGYCAKCPCKGDCGHVLPGRLAQLFRRPSGPYTMLEYGILFVSLVLIAGFPQFWLWRYPKLFAGFWGCLIVAGLQIVTVMCRACTNVYCPMKRQSTS